MRDAPLLISRVAVKAAADVIVDTTVSDGIEIEPDPALEHWVASAQRVIDQQEIIRLLGKFRRGADPAVFAIARSFERRDGAPDLGFTDHRRIASGLKEVAHGCGRFAWARSSTSGRWFPHACMICSSINMNSSRG